MLVIFMVIISSSKKTQASCLRTEIVTQKKAFASFLFKRVFMFIRLVRFGHLYGRLRYVAGLSILFPFVNFLTQSFVQFFSRNLNASSSLQRYMVQFNFKKNYDICIYIYLFYSMFIFAIFIQENVTSCPLCDLCPFSLKTHRGSCR